VTIRRPLALLAALACLLGGLVAAAPAHAAERVVTITAEGVTPQVLQVAAGDVVTFVNEDTAFTYRAVATSDNWELDSGPVGLLPGRSYTHPDPLTAPGTYTYRVADGEPFAGSVVLAAPQSPSPGPSSGGTGSSKPSPATTSGPSSASPSPAGAPGSAPLPPIPGVDPAGTPVTPAPGGVAPPPPAIALPELPGESAGPLPETASEPEDESDVIAAVPGRLGSGPSSRGYGLPAALAAVLAAGVASLLVRLLLAEPAARRRARRAMDGRAPVVTTG
jgi:plastocyanin